MRANPEIDVIIGKPQWVLRIEERLSAITKVFYVIIIMNLCAFVKGNHILKIFKCELDPVGTSRTRRLFFDVECC